MSSPHGEVASWLAVLAVLNASSTATQTAFDRWRDAHEALMRELRSEPQLMQAWRDWLKAEAHAYENGPANV
jgi:hypothetical protein